MSGKEQRQVRPVILTDRVVTPDIAESREWALTDTLHAQVLPVGYGGIRRPVVVVTNKVEHLMPLLTTGQALALMADVDPDDFDFGRHDLVAQRAHQSERLIGRAKEELNWCWLDKTIDPLVASAMFWRLRENTFARVSFSKSWEVAVPLYATMVLKQARHLESPMLCAMFGSDSRTPESVRQDQARARKFMNLIMQGKDLDVDDQPSLVNARRLTEKYLAVVVPLLLPPPSPALFQLEDFSTVTRKGGRVTCHPKKSRHEDTNRPPGTSAINALPTGFFARQGSSR